MSDHPTDEQPVVAPATPADAAAPPTPGDPAPEVVAARPAPEPQPATSTAAAAATEMDVVRARSASHPVLAPALIIAGVMLWAFVVLGTYTTSWISAGGAPLSGGVAVVLVLCLVLGACRFAEVRSRAHPIPGVRGPVARFVLLGLVGFTLWLTALLIVTVAGKSSRSNVDLVAAAGLLAVAAASVVIGDRMLGRTGLPRNAAQRFLVLAAWLAVGVVTLGAFVELLAE